MTDFEAIWARLPIPGEFDSMDACDQELWRTAVQCAIELAREWRPIETAPDDGTCVLLAWFDGQEWQVFPGAMKRLLTGVRGWVVAVMDIEYLNGGHGQRFSDFAASPTHWMNLAPPPITPQQPTESFPPHDD